MVTENMRAATVAVSAMGCFAVNDAIMKLVMLSLPQLQSIFIRGIFVVPFLAMLSLLRRELRPIHRIHWRQVVLRMVGDVGTTLCVLGALHSGPMADVAVILGAGPLCVMLGAAACLGERIDGRAWAMGVLGLFGVALVAKPTATGVSPHAGLALLGNGFAVLRDLVARRISSEVPATMIAALSAVAVMVTAGLGGAWRGDWARPSSRELSFLGVASALLGVAQVGSVVQMRMGDVGFVQPFRYVYIVFAALLGAIVFHQLPDLWTIVGAAIVTSCGLLSIVRERRRGHHAPKGARRLRDGADESRDVGHLATVAEPLDHRPAPTSSQVETQTDTASAADRDTNGGQSV